MAKVGERMIESIYIKQSYNVAARLECPDLRKVGMSLWAAS
uniref:Uncharacterized protein n=1 Tax=Rhizobium rhizogenes TaxID=359 RepID=A0A7S5DQJ6_RHIRH|nr:hypothetical protein pC5.7b_322 [Rhizobium rhizogenes]QCL09821.1 hypothetical protein pC5.8b_331 [Rhizobium rhizogenes]